MSQFKTVLSSVIVAALDKLPKGSTIESASVTPNKKGIEVLWSHPDFKTGYVTPFDWTEEQLAAQELPSGVKTPPPTLVIPEESKLEVTGTALPLKVDKNAPKSVKRR